MSVKRLGCIAVLMGLVVMWGCGGDGPSTPTLQSISIQSPSTSVVLGRTLQLTALGNYNNQTSSPLSGVTWTSSNPAVATIANGLVTSVGQGTTTLTVTSAGVSTSVTITVTAPEVTQVDVAPATQQINVGQTHQLTATARYTNNTSADVTTQATWTSADTTKVSVAAGLVNGVAAGASITVSAQFGGKTGTASITVTAPVLQSLSMSPVNASVVQGTSIHMTVTGTMSDSSAAPPAALANIVWQSSDNAKATVVSEVTGPAMQVSGVSTGHVTITASLGSVTISTGLDVIAPSVTQVEISPSTQTMNVGSTFQFTATARYNNDDAVDVTGQATWESSDTSKVEIGYSGTAGLAYGVAATGGTNATISATFGGKTGTAGVGVVVPVTVNYGGFVYAMAQNSTDHALHIFTVQDDGRLNIVMNVSPLDILISLSQKQVHLAMHPSKEFLAILYRPVTCDSTSTGFLGLYRIHTLSGVPYRVQGSPFALENPCPTQLSFSPDGKRLYVADGSGHTAQECTTMACESTIKTYAFNAFSGTIGGSQSSVTMPGRDVSHIAFTPDSKYAYVVGSDSGGDGANVMYAYSVDATTGALTQVTGSPYAPWKYGQYATVDSTGTRLFAQDGNISQILFYDIAADTGALSSFGSMQNTASKTMAFDPVNQWMYASVWSGTDASISSYQYNPTTGALTYKKSFAESSEWPVTLAVHPLGGVVYSGTSNGKLNVYSVDATGGDVSKLQSNLLWKTETTPDVAYAPKAASDGFLFSFGNYNPLSAVLVDDTGSFAGIPSYSIADPNNYEPQFVVSNALGHMFVSYRYGLPSRMASFLVNRNTGSVTKAGSIDFPSNIPNIAPHPSGKFVYLVQYGENYEVFIDKVDVNPETAEFTSGSTRLITIPNTYPGGFTSEGMKLNSAGTVLYFVTRDYNTVDGAENIIFHVRTYSVDPNTGALTEMQDVHSTKRLVETMTFDSTGKFLYIPAWEFGTYNDSLEIYSVGQDGTVALSSSLASGKLAEPPTRLRSTNGYLFIGWSDYGGGIKVYSVNPTTGVPTKVAETERANFPDFVVNDDGSRVYVLGYEGSSPAFQAYRVDLTSSVLTKTSSISLYPNGTYQGMVYIKKP
ncbi:MAG TPA: Ig-like domain-containing protein [Terriglobales bacterium]|nr:Ig-like domain-containing protein [Terriglobales bacterium]